ncbi:MAG: enolase C-terminal domain-like protein, partial [Xanthobacteraceae bacterium]
MAAELTFQSLEARVVSVPLRRPVVSRVGEFRDWPLILIDLYTSEGVTGRAYLEPYLKNSARAIVSMLGVLAEAMAGRRLAPLSDFQGNRKSLNLVGYEGIAMIAVSGLDMAIWDAFAKSAEQPLAVLLGSSVGGVPAYNSNGLWLTETATLAREAEELCAEGGFTALKLRLGRDRLADDLVAIAEVRRGAGDDVKLMVDFNQGLSLGDALARCHALDDAGLYWFEEPITYNNISGYAQLAAELATPLQIGENFYGPRELFNAVQARACDYVMPDLMRIGGVSGWLRSAPIAAAAGIQVSSHLYPEVAAHLLRA